MICCFAQSVAGWGWSGPALVVFSGFRNHIHELVISVPARGGYGLPTLYFLAQGAGVVVERSRPGRALGLRHGFRGWCFTFVIAAIPAFWLFHPPFVLRVIMPFLHAVHAL